MIDTLCIVLVVTCIIVSLYGLYLLHRLENVCNFRTDILKFYPEVYDEIPSFEYMLFNPFYKIRRLK